MSSFNEILTEVESLASQLAGALVRSGASAIYPHADDNGKAILRYLGLGPQVPAGPLAHIELPVDEGPALSVWCHRSEFAPHWYWVTGFADQYGPMPDCPLADADHSPCAEPESVVLTNLGSLPDEIDPASWRSVGCGVCGRRLTLSNPAARWLCQTCAAGNGWDGCTSTVTVSTVFNVFGASR